MRVLASRESREFARLGGLSIEHEHMSRASYRKLPVIFCNLGIFSNRARAGGLAYPLPIMSATPKPVIPDGQPFYNSRENFRFFPSSKHFSLSHGRAPEHGRNSTASLPQNGNLAARNAARTRRKILRKPKVCDLTKPYIPSPWSKEKSPSCARP